MQLQHPMMGIFLRAMEDSFTTADFQMMAPVHFGLRFDKLTNSHLPWSVQVVEIHDYFHRRNITEQLVTVLKDARPDVSEFSLVADSMGFSEISTGLEVLVRSGGTPYQDVEQFRARLATIEAAICQIDVGGSVGTGTLVGDDLVLTNHHVVAAQLAKEGKLTETVICRFDYKTNTDRTFKTPAVDVKALAWLAESPHAHADTVVGPMSTDLNKLDYAILRLERKIASEPLVKGGAPRGSVRVDGVNVANVNAGVLVIQHPAGDPMKIDFGSVVETGPARFRHSVNTERGSSGAPVFDASLNLIGIHHAGHSGGLGPKLTYNEGIPLGAILYDARAKRVKI